MNEREAYIALNMAQGIGPATVAGRIAALGSAVALFGASASALSRVKGISRASAETFARAFGALDWRGEIERAVALNTALLTPVDAAYPPLLKQIHGSPLALYVTGAAATLSLPCVGIVGTRAPTPYRCVRLHARAGGIYGRFGTRARHRHGGAQSRARGGCHGGGCG